MALHVIKQLCSTYVVIYNSVPECHVLAKVTENFVVFCHSGQVTVLKMEAADPSETFRFTELHLVSQNAVGTIRSHVL